MSLGAVLKAEGIAMFRQGKGGVANYGDIPPNQTLYAPEPRLKVTNGSR